MGDDQAEPAPADPVQAKMFAFMPLIFTFMMATFPAGLVIYWTWNNMLTGIQQYVVMRRQGVEDASVRESQPAQAGRAVKKLSAARPAASEKDSPEARRPS